MEWVPVSSSNIEAIGYEEPPVARLYVRFTNGKEYMYENVLPSAYDGLMNSPSIGSYFHQNIRNHYGFVAL